MCYFPTAAIAPAPSFIEHIANTIQYITHGTMPKIATLGWPLANFGHRLVTVANSQTTLTGTKKTAKNTTTPV